MCRRAMDVIYRTSGPSRFRVAFAFWYGKDGDINMPRYAVEGLMSAALVGKLEASTDEKCLGCSDQSVCFATQTVGTRCVSSGSNFIPCGTMLNPPFLDQVETGSPLLGLC